MLSGLTQRSSVDLGTHSAAVGVSKDDLIRSSATSIPKLIMQTHPYHQQAVPKKVSLNFQRFAPDYRRVVYTDEECVSFLRKHFDEGLVTLFGRLKEGAHKADLFRYAYLYQHGGFYMDIKCELIRPLSEVHAILTAHKARVGTVIGIKPSRGQPTIFQGFIATAPRNPLFLSLIDRVRRDHAHANRNYLIFTRDFYRQISAEFYNGSVEEGLSPSGRVFLFKEVGYNKSMCPMGLDTYGLCSYIAYRGEHVLKTRYADYPWAPFGGAFAWR